MQFLPAYNELVEEAVQGARTEDYEGVSVRVVGPEYLVALAIQAGGSKRRERAIQLLESGAVDRAQLGVILERYHIEMGDLLNEH